MAAGDVRHRLRLLALAACVPLLAACENNATAYAIDGSQHALILVREQPYFWNTEINQFIIASRLPVCQRKVAIHPGAKTLVPIEVYEAGDLLWALRQGERWYLASTERCIVQDWNNPNPQPPGAQIGTFRLEGDKPVFIRAGV